MTGQRTSRSLLGVLGVVATSTLLVLASPAAAGQPHLRLAPSLAAL